MDVQELYLDLLKKSLTRFGEDDLVQVPQFSNSFKGFIKRKMLSSLRKRKIESFTRIPFNAEKRQNGRDWPSTAETMIGIKRLDNLEQSIRTIFKENIKGDFVETGVWRGGASIFMKAMLTVLGDNSRRLWCADSFIGLPSPDLEKYPQDSDMTWHTQSELAVDLETVKRNFQRYDMLDNRVEFLVGWFKNTLSVAPISEISLLRLDGDMYESTMDALVPLYGKVSVGGFIIVDDYGLPEDTCRRAIHDFRALHNISNEIVDIDGWGAYWRKY